MYTASSHNGRYGTAKHVGRDFPLEKAKHIDVKRTGRNMYWCWDMGTWLGKLPGKTREETARLYAGTERRYYDKRFQKALDEQNERHVKARHLDRIKTMDDWLSGKNTRCEESIYQIGDMDDDIDSTSFTAALTALIGWLEKWSKEHGEPFAILDFSIHLDEASPHAQVRRVWQYRDERGVWHIGQNKALESAGVELPDPDGKTGPKNNRKITFDRMVRAKWMEICEEYGYEIQRTPGDNAAHLPKEQVIELRMRKKELAQEAARQTARGETLDRKEKALAGREEAVRSSEKTLGERVRDANAHVLDIAQKRSAAADELAKARKLMADAGKVMTELTGLKSEMDEQQRTRYEQVGRKGRMVRDGLATMPGQRQRGGTGPEGPGG